MKASIHIPDKLIISLVSVLFFLIFFSYLTPMYVRWLPGVKIIDQVVMYLSMLVMLLIALKEYQTIQWPIILLIIPYSVLFISSYLNNGEVVESAKHMFKVLLLCLTVGSIINRGKDTEKLLRFVAGYSCIFVMLNTVLVLIYPSGIPGMSTVEGIPFFHYGNVNTTVKFILPGTLCSYLLDARENIISLRTMLFNFGILAIYIFSYHATTALIGMLFFFVWFLMRRKLCNKGKFLYIVVVISIIVIEILIIVLTNSFLIYKISAFFGKDPTFAGRTTLWKNILKWIGCGSFLGYGEQDGDTLLRMIGNVNGSHNYYLDIIFQRGYIGLLCFFILVCIPIFNKNQSKNQMDMYILLGCCCTYLIMFTFEPFYITEYFFVPIFYAAALLSLHRKTQTFFYFGNNLSIIVSHFFSTITRKSVWLYEQELSIFSCRSNN